MTMKMKHMAGLALAASLFMACDDMTDNIGSSLINDPDRLEITTDTFKVSTRSIMAGPVLSRNTTGYLGKVRDQETGCYLTSDFMSQFFCVEDFQFPVKDSIRSLKDGNVVADSCDVCLYYKEYYGDSLATMKVEALELAKPVLETQRYYSDFDPEQEGFVKSDGLKVKKIYTLVDENVDESEREEDDYMACIRIPLNVPYKGYDNFGTYLMRTYYDSPELFKNAYTFIHNVVPGFYFKSQSGLGSMAYISLSQINVYYTHRTTMTLSDGETKKDTTIVGAATFPGTEEVLQTTRIENDMQTLQRLVSDNSCTYIKSPAGIFTEMTLPVNEIINSTYTDKEGNVRTHANDTINTAKVILTRINDTYNSEFSLDPPATLLMVPKSEITSFFEQNKVADYKTSFIATYSKTDNTYTFNNIGGLIQHLYNGPRNDDDWNKVVIIPVTVSYNASTGALTKVTHDMSMTSTRLVGGSENKYADIKISVIYSKFK